MGASLSLALKQKGISASITGVVGSTKSKIKGQSLKSADQILTSEEFSSTRSWKDYDFIIFGVPVDLTVKLISELPTDFSGIITDLGSTKKEIIHAVETHFSSGHNYISSHPMCGSEESGLEFANSSLYEGRLCILTSPKNVKLGIQDRLEKLLEICRDYNDRNFCRGTRFYSIVSITFSSYTFLDYGGLGS